jgi:putative ABC transport system permease protein
MPDPRSVNRSMFWRVLRRSVFANRGRLLVILLALGAGAAITAALLNLQVDAKRRVTTEFRSFGANVLIVPRGESGNVQSPTGTLDESIYGEIPKKNGSDLVSKAALLYGIARANRRNPGADEPDTTQNMPIVVVGYEYYGSDLSDIFPSLIVGRSARPMSWIDMGEPIETPSQTSKNGHAIKTPVAPLAALTVTGCQLGETLASKLQVAAGQWVYLKSDFSDVFCLVGKITRSGGPEDSQLFLGLAFAQRIFRQQGRVNTVLLNVPGSSGSVAHFVSDLRASLPAVKVEPIRQFTESQSRIYQRISGILTATVAVVLILTALCVMAAMTNVAMERKNDVGLMKAIGGSVRRVLRLFLAEAALLGLAGGLIGAAIGIVISIGLGKAVFGVAAQPRLIVYPISVALTVIVAILAAYPLRRLVHIKPAAVFRGEE